MHLKQQPYALALAALRASFGPAIFANADPASRIANLTNQQETAIGRSQALIDAADAAGRALSADEKRTIRANTERVEALQKQIDDLQDEIDFAAGPQPLTSAPVMARLTPADSIDPIDRPLDGGARAYRTAFGAERDGRFASLFAGRQSARPVPGFRTFGEYCAAIASGRPDNRLMAATMTETVGADGGYMVPVQYLAPMLDASLQIEKVRPHAVVIPMDSKSATVGLFDDADGTNNARGGLRMLWGAEAAEMTEQKGKTREMTLTATKANIFVRVSAELLEDAVAFDRQLSEAMRNAVAAGLDSVFVNGSAVAQPLGVLNGASLITVSKESGQTSSAPVLLQNLAKMVGRLSPSSFARSRWLIHPTVVPALYLLSVTTMNLAGSENVGGGHVAAVTQDAEGNLRIFGRPVDVTDACAPLSTVGDIILADWGRYVIGLRRDATIARDESRYFDSDEIAFKLTLRVDGKPADAAATKLRDGSNTVAPFVALETR